MNFFKILEDVAPTLGKAISGDFGGALNEALRAFGINNGTKEDLANSLKKATPEQIAELKRIESEYKIRIQEISNDLEQIHSNDRNSARNMQIEDKSKFLPILAIVVMIGALLFTGALFVIEVPIENQAILNMVLGLIMGYAGHIISFYFGSSKGSADKNKMLSVKGK